MGRDAPLDPVSWDYALVRSNLLDQCVTRHSNKTHSTTKPTSGFRRSTAIRAFHGLPSDTSQILSLVPPAGPRLGEETEFTFIEGKD